MFICASHPPEWQSVEFPDPAEIAFFIRKTEQIPLQRKVAATGKLLPVTNDAAKGSPKPGAVGRARQTAGRGKVVGRVNAVLLLMKGINTELAAPKPKQQQQDLHYSLRQVEAPRTGSPADPVVLLVGDAVKPTNRHGTDGLLMGDILQLELNPNASINTRKVLNLYP